MGPKKQIKKQVVEQPVVEQPPPIPPHQLKGVGKFIYNNEALYQGEWHLFNSIKMKHGKGTLTIFPKGKLAEQKYNGSWYMDKMEGYGVYNYADGSVYRGNWKQNKHWGKGQFQFANGTVYEGEWMEHLMDGSGFYIDDNGLKWEGEFRKGKFQTKLQEQLVKERKLRVAKQSIKTQIHQLINLMTQQFTKSDKKTLKENMGGYFGIDVLKQFVKEPYSKLQQRPQQKWIQLLNIAKNGEIKVLGKQIESQILGVDRILKKQLEGNGQIVQISGVKDERTVKLVFLCVNKNWLVVLSQDDEKKK